MTFASSIKVFLLAGLLMSVGTAEASNSKSLKSLGSQEVLLDKARPSLPANTYRVIQRRAIDREYRFEFDVSAGGVAGGDSYFNSKNLGLQAEFHLSNRWSLGLRHLWNFNDLTAEGKRRFDYAEASYAAGNFSPDVPDLDWPISTSLATISFYPLYGKVSWFESTVSYFDFYLLAGGGMVNLRRGQSPIGAAGIGMGMWWTDHLTSRIEAVYQNYEDQMISGKRRIQNANISFSMGFLL